MNTSDFSSFLSEHTAVIEPLMRNIALSYWKATISGRREDFERYAALEIEMQAVYTDRKAFGRLNALRESGSLSDPLQSRALDILYRQYLRHQADPSLLEEAMKRSTAILNTFNVFRARVGTRELTSNEVRNILRTSTDSDERRSVWEAEKEVGPRVSREMLELVGVRNEIARSLGFDDYYVMSLELAEQRPADISSLFDRIEELTREPYRKIKREVDEALARRCGIDASDIMPWHYEDPFFQEAPRVESTDLDACFRGCDVVRLVRDFFDGMGLDVDDVLDQSDLYEKPGKEQHAYCMDIDRRGDIRILANVQDDEMWTGTMLHELGHAVYDKYVERDLPFILREHAHIFVTEAVAMFFGRLSKDAGWIAGVTGMPESDRDRIEHAVGKQQRLAQLVFARWCQVMVRFERDLYRQPGANLGAAWWDIVEKCQMVRAPENRDAPDWATKIHIVSAPVYYHNYMLGELLASQLHATLSRELGGSYNGGRSLAGNVAAGTYLRDRLFRTGRSLTWEETVRRSTGEDLNPDHFAGQFVHM